MIDKKRFEQAVSLAAAFVANGDIRLGRDKIDRNSTPFLLLQDTIVATYEMLAVAEDEVSHSEGYK